MTRLFDVISMYTGSQLIQERYPLVTVVTPCYNAARFISETIESVRDQDYPRIEHIIFDGGSTDGTLDILARYAHLDWTSEPDRGQSHALNKGFKKARGEIIGWLNADDAYQPGAIRSVVYALCENLDVDLIYGDLQIIDQDGGLGIVRRAQPFNYETFFAASYIPQPTVFMRRKVIEILGGVDERLHYVMDREFWLRAGLCFNLRYLPGVVLARFRYASGSKTYQSASKFHAEWLQVLDDAFQRLDFQKIPSRVRRTALRKARANIYMNRFGAAVNEHDRQAVLINFFQAISQDIKLLLNRGVYGFLADGLLGTSLMKNRSRYGLRKP